ncbi:putative Ig domain-containing protein, partial [Ciceribacter lividus]
PVAGAVTATVAANSSANPITLDISGGSAASVAVDTQANHGTATASGTSITYTPTAGYSGSDSFTYTATNATGTSTAATVSITVTAPTLTFSPASGALPDGTVATAYSETISASAGTAPYTYAVASGSLPAGLTLSSGGILSGTPTTAGSYSFAVKATDANNAATSASYTVAIGVQAPVAGAVTATVAANSSANPITLDISGGSAASVAVDTQANHGTATASGTSITYTPTAGYSGSDSFTYTATNATGTSTAATVSIAVTAPTLTFSPASGALPDGTVATAYSKTMSASAGTAPYTYAVASGSLPAGLTLSSGGILSGTPTTAGSYSFAVKATDANGTTGEGTYTLTVAPPAATFVFTPSGGALTAAMVGEDYSQSISATGGRGTLIYSLASGTLPKGLTLNVSTGELTGPLTVDAEAKDYSFTIQVRDGNGSTGTASYTLTVKSRVVTVTDQVVVVPAGSSPTDVYLNRGATGGPFTKAEMTYVKPSSAGTATIIRGQLAQAGAVTIPVGWYLQFTPNPAYTGQVQVGFRLTSDLGTSNTGMVTYSIAMDAAQVASDVNLLVHDFVRSRQNMIASSIKVPGLLQRRQMEQATEPVTARMMPSENGMTAQFSTSLAQMTSAEEATDGAPGGYSSPFNIWIDGTFLAHNDKDVNGNKWGLFGMINLGADYLLTDKSLLGLSFHYDYMTDPTDTDAKLTGNGWMAGPYASFEIGKGVFWNTSLLYGGSSNTIDTEFWDGTFESERWMADTSIEGQWALDEDTTLTPKLRALYFLEKVKDYSVKNSAGDTIGIDGFDEQQFRVSLGAEIARSFTLESGAKLTPKLGLTGGVSGLDGAGPFGSVTAGLSLQTADMWTLDSSLLFNIEGDGEKSIGARVGAVKRF